MTYLIKQMKIYKYIIVLSFLSLWLNSYFPSKGLYILGLFMILVFGIFHGANDIVIINKSIKTLKNKSLIVLIGFYLTIVGIFAVFFSFLPDIALLTFVLLSAYHFGEQHWDRILKSTNYLMKFIFEFIYGCIIFGLIFMFHQNEVEEIVAAICNYSVSLNFLPYLLIVLGSMLLVIGFIIYKSNRLFKSQLSEQILYLLVLTIIFKVTNLIFSFAIYFVLWHSIPSLYDQINFIYGDVTKKSILMYIKNAFLYWLISIVGLIVFYWLLKDTEIFEALLFSFIAAITFPHVLVINNMFKKNSKS